MNCHPIRFDEEACDRVVEDQSSGLNSHVNFDIIFVRTEQITTDWLKQMKKLQPKSKVSAICKDRLTSVLDLVRSVDLAETMRRLDLTASQDVQ